MSEEERVPGARELIDFSQATVVTPPNLSRVEANAIAMLIEEVEKRSLLRWNHVTAWPVEPGPLILVGTAPSLRALEGTPAHLLAATTAPEGYQLRVSGDSGKIVVSIVGNDARGVLYGIGHLLRTLRLNRQRASLPNDLNVATAPRFALRGHQLGYRDKTNSYDGWDLRQWRQYIRDLAVFGANAIEIIPPRSDDRPTSVHFPLPPLETMAGVSQIADDYGLDLWVWYPAMDQDYSDPATVEQAVDEWAQVLRKLPRLDALFVPGGDPGHARPRMLMALLEKQILSLRRFHPKLQIWVSPQGFSQEWLDEFLGVLQEGVDWLTGVVHGPWVYLPMAEFRRVIPDRYLLRNYPDITHSLACQFPVPDWDVAYALTEGREGINPRPLGQAAIFQKTQPPTVGFLTYSEGCHDDLNKAIWSGLGWNPEADVLDILRDYSRYFIGEAYADDFAQGLLALERNWQGSLASNASVDTTLLQFQALEAVASPRVLQNWRFQQALYRAYYDAYVRHRLLYESALEEQAMDQLQQAEARGSFNVMAEAERILDRAVQQPIATTWRTRIFQLAEALFQSIQMQLSVRLYQGQAEVRGANLDGLDYPLNDRLWLQERFAEIRQRPDEAARLAGIEQILQWTNPGPGGFYDDLSNPFLQSHLVHSLRFEEDPEFRSTPLRRFPYRKHPGVLRRAWRTYTGAWSYGSFQMRYSGLDPNARYRLRIVYPPTVSEVNLHLTANDGVEVHASLAKQDPPLPREFDLPPQATQTGQLVLTWHGDASQGGNPGTLGVSEVWLMKIPARH